MFCIWVGGVMILGWFDGFFLKLKGFFVGLDGFVGWDDGFDLCCEVVDCFGQYGQFDMFVFNGFCVVLIDGYVFVWLEFELGYLCDLIMGLGVFGDLLCLMVDYQGSI